MAGSKIMVVDDDSNICELLRLYLEKEGYDTILAETEPRLWKNSTGKSRISSCWIS